MNGSLYSLSLKKLSDKQKSKTMAIDVLVKTEIDRPRKEVATYAFDPDNDPLWIGGIKEAHLLTRRPVGLGTRVQRLAKFMGKTIDYVLEVTDFETDRLMVMKSLKSPFPMKVTYRFDDLDNNKTLAQIRVEGSSKGFYKLTDFLMAPMVRRNLKQDLERLKNRFLKSS